MTSPAHPPRRVRPAQRHSQGSRGRAPSFERARAELASRLQERRGEIEEAVLTRAIAVSGPSEPSDPEYAEGLRNAVSAAVGYSLELVEVGEERAPAPPPTLLAQARLAARNGVELATVLRRYSAGYVLISDFLVEEVERAGYGGTELQRLLRSQGTLDRMLAAVSEEHGKETSQRQTSAEERRVERIERLLGGELVDTAELEYNIEGHHLALLIAGPGVAPALRELAASMDCRLLTACREEGILWAWLGSRRELDPEDLKRHLPATWPDGSTLAIGESGTGLVGWRFSYRQAKAAFSVAQRSHEFLVRYADVALLASVLQDDLLATSLRQLYLAPLEAERDGGKVAKETLGAYYAAERNVSSAAARLGVNRNTVTSRLRAIEGIIGRPLSFCGAELEVALCLAELEMDRPPAANLAPR